jgi:uncharacterized lipoprotein YddW (UPF0748 family)
MKNLTILFLVIFISSTLFSQSIPPKREFRAAWIATVTNIDWPSSNLLSTAQQKQGLIDLLDELKRDGINTVIFQVRSECDAMYSSAFDPWSFWLTGSQGNPPFPYYDPLEFAIDEAHKRGMELHAWFNPYRADRKVTGTGSYPKASNHVTVQHPDWIIQISTFKFLDPGLPMVRDYVSSVIYDIVSRYDVDGIHADDYFYPYPPDQITNQDAATFAAYPRGFTNLANWRRDNVNLLIAQVNDSIQSVKPWVKFGMSPFGIWKNGVPPGISGLDAYSTIYCDAIAWLHDRSIDYLTPQLYWPFGGGQDYAKLQPWWADSVAANGRHFYPGHAYYRIAAWFNPTEMPNQIRFDRNNPKVQGSVFFSAKHFGLNPLGVTDTLRNDLYRYQSILPIMSWKDVVPPNPIQNLRFERLANGQAGLLWDIPQSASDGDSASRYVVYRFDFPNVQPGDLNNSANILNIEGSRQSIPGEPPSATGPYHFVVTSLDRNYNESGMSTVLTVNPPPVPVLVSPENIAINIADTVVLKWNYPNLSSSYRLQVATDPAFTSEIFVDQDNIADTFKVLTGLNGQTQYYWRLNSSNAGGTSSFSGAYSFTTGFPVSPILFYPDNNMGSIPVDTVLYWNASVSAQNYDLMLARSLDFAQSSIFADTTGLTDTTFAVSGLNFNTFYFWKIRGNNQFGKSNWTTPWRFKTVDPTGIDGQLSLPNSFALEQNYPNPFNPTTRIRFNIAQAGNASLKIYNLLGQEVAILLHEFMNPGTYDIEFNASKLASGIYFYRIKVNDFSASKKMILMK